MTVNFWLYQSKREQSLHWGHGDTIAPSYSASRSLSYCYSWCRLWRLLIIEWRIVGDTAQRIQGMEDAQCGALLQVIYAICAAIWFSEGAAKDRGDSGICLSVSPFVTARSESATGRNEYEKCESFGESRACCWSSLFDRKGDRGYVTGMEWVIPISL